MCTSRQRGLSLIELIMFIVIVGSALAGVLSVLNFTTKSSADPMVRKQALAIAEQIREGKPGQELNLSFVDTMSQVYRKVNRMDDAQRLLTEALPAHPEHSNLHFELGQVYLDQDPLASGEAFRNALAYGLNPEKEKEARLRLAELQEK